MCSIVIIDMRNNSKVTVEGTFDTFGEALNAGGISLDFSKAKGIIKETRVSLEGNSSRLPNLASMRIFITAKDSKGGVAKYTKKEVTAIINKVEQSLYDQIEAKFEEIRKAFTGMITVDNTASAEDLKEGEALIKKIR